MASELKKGEKMLHEIVKSDIQTGNRMKTNSRIKQTSRLANNMKNLLDKNSYCDFTLISAVDGTKIPVHRIVLVACSRYFNDIFSKEKIPMKEIAIGCITGDRLRAVIDYFYTGQIEIAPDNVEILLYVASEFEFVDITEECSKYLEFYLNKNPLNCAAYYAVADMYNIADLRRLSMQFMCHFFNIIKDTPSFAEISPNLLLELLSSDNLNVQREEDVFNAVLAWITFDESNRMRYRAVLFKLIRFTLMEIPFLIKNVVKLLMSIGLDDLCEEILSIKYNPLIEAKLIPASLLIPRNVKKPTENHNIETFAFLYEWETSTLHREVYSNSEWKALHSIELPIPDQIYAIVKWQNFWFVFGENGRVICMDMFSNTITSVPDIPGPREDYAVAIHNDCIYVVGGILVSGELAHVIEKYDIANKTWSSYLSNIATRIHYPIVTVLNGKLYYADESRYWVASIDLSSGAIEWLPLPINRDKIEQIMSYNGQIYIANYRYIQKYDLRTKTWTLVSAHYNEEMKTVPNEKSNGLFWESYSLSDDSTEKIKIARYLLSENKWLDYGELQQIYSPELEPCQIFLFTNK